MDAPRPSSVESSPFDTYPVRIMLGLVGSLGLLLALVHTPLRSPVDRVGWSTRPAAEQIVLRDLTAEEEPPDAAATEATESLPPATVFSSSSSSPESTPSDEAGTEATEPGSDPPDDNWAQRYKDLQSISELGVTDQSPTIVGGAGSLYLHINYPARAREQGIQGRLELEFTVERDGSIRDVEVVKSLHPLCDSAAVHGLRSVQFVPAKHDGNPVPIRLRLPVRFELTTATSSRPPGK